MGSTGASIFSTRTEGRTLAMYLRSWLWRVSGSVMPRTEIELACGLVIIDDVFFRTLAGNGD